MFVRRFTTHRASFFQVDLTKDQLVAISRPLRAAKLLSQATSEDDEDDNNTTANNNNSNISALSH